jgi:hypothetical protein
VKLILVCPPVHPTVCKFRVSENCTNFSYFTVVQNCKAFLRAALISRKLFAVAQTFQDCLEL